MRRLSVLALLLCLPSLASAGLVQLTFGGAFGGDFGEGSGFAGGELWFDPDESGFLYSTAAGATQGEFVTENGGSTILGNMPFDVGFYSKEGNFISMWLSADFFDDDSLIGNRLLVLFFPPSGIQGVGLATLFEYICIDDAGCSEFNEDSYFRSGLAGYRVPEPATAVLFGLGIVALAIRRRRNNNS